MRNDSSQVASDITLMNFLPVAFCELFVIFFRKTENVERSCLPLQSSSMDMTTSAFEAPSPNEVDAKVLGDETSTFNLTLDLLSESSEGKLSNLEIACWHWIHDSV